MNKLLFTLKECWGQDLVLVANNEKDLEDYLRQELDYSHVSFDSGGQVNLKKREWSDYETGETLWIKHV